MKKLCVSVAALALLNLQAEEIALDAITISTTGLGQDEAVEDVQASVEVLDQKAIQSLSGRTTAQVLNEAVGLNVKDGSSTSQISIRGFADAHTLILVDGLRRTGKYGAADISSIALEDIERIEIVRGPMSALYGSDAVGGIINIITRTASDKERASITLIGGIAQNYERKTGILRANLNLPGERISHTISAEIKERGDYREDKESIATDLRDESHLSLSYANRIPYGDDALKLRFELFHQDDKGVYYAALPFPPFSVTTDTYEKEDRYQASGIYNHVGDDYLFDTALAYGYSDADVDRASGSETTQYSQGELNNYLRIYPSDAMTHIIGFGAKYEAIDVSMYSKTADRTNYNLLYQNEWDITEDFSTVVGVRYDHYSDFGSTTNPRLSARYAIGDAYLRASYGEAFKAPSFTNMYSSFYRGTSIHIFGNPDLKPETSKTYELAMGYAKGALATELVLHRSKLDDLIDSYYVDATNVTYTNIAKATIEGAELSITYQATEALRLKGSFEYLDAEDDTTGTRLPDNARFTGKLHAAYTADTNTTYYLNLRTLRNYLGAIEGTRPTQYEDLDYTVADVKATHQWSKAISVSAGIDNITNKKMPYGLTTFGTPSDPGERYYYVSITATF